MLRASYSIREMGCILLTEASAVPPSCPVLVFSTEAGTVKDRLFDSTCRNCATLRKPLIPPWTPRPAERAVRSIGHSPRETSSKVARHGLGTESVSVCADGLSRYSVLSSRWKDRRLAAISQTDIHIEPPQNIRKQSIICCQIVILLRSTVLRPAPVMAETTRNRLST